MENQQSNGEHPPAPEGFGAASPAPEPQPGAAVPQRPQAVPKDVLGIKEVDLMKEKYKSLFKRKDELSPVEAGFVEVLKENLPEDCRRLVATVQWIGQQNMRLAKIAQGLQEQIQAQANALSALAFMGGGQLFIPMREAEKVPDGTGVQVGMVQMNNEPCIHVKLEGYGPGEKPSVLVTGKMPPLPFLMGKGAKRFGLKGRPHGF